MTPAKTNPPSRFSNYKILPPKLGGGGGGAMKSYWTWKVLQIFANTGSLVLVLRLNHPTANLTLLQGMAGSSFVNCELVHPNQKYCSVFIILLIIFLVQLVTIFRNHCRYGLTIVTPSALGCWILGNMTIPRCAGPAGPIKNAVGTVDVGMVVHVTVVAIANLYI